MDIPSPNLNQDSWKQVQDLVPKPTAQREIKHYSITAKTSYPDF